MLLHNADRRNKRKTQQNFGRLGAGRVTYCSASDHQRTPGNYYTGVLGIYSSLHFSWCVLLVLQKKTFNIVDAELNFVNPL